MLLAVHCYSSAASDLLYKCRRCSYHVCWWRLCWFILWLYTCLLNGHPCINTGTILTYSFTNLLNYLLILTYLFINLLTFLITCLLAYLRSRDFRVKWCAQDILPCAKIWCGIRYVYCKFDRSFEKHSLDALKAWNILSFNIDLTVDCVYCR